MVDELLNEDVPDVPCRIEDVRPGESVVIIMTDIQQEWMNGLHAVVAWVNKEMQRITVMVNPADVPLDKRKGLYVSARTGGVPMVLVEGEFDKYGGRIQI